MRRPDTVIVNGPDPARVLTGMILAGLADDGHLRPGSRATVEAWRWDYWNSGQVSSLKWLTRGWRFPASVRREPGHNMQASRCWRLGHKRFPRVVTEYWPGTAVFSSAVSSQIEQWCRRSRRRSRPSARASHRSQSSPIWFISRVRVVMDITLGRTHEVGYDSTNPHSARPAGQHLLWG